MIISQSRIKTWRRCHRKHYYKHVEDLAKKVRAAPLLRGTVLHEMIEARDTKKLPWKVYDTFEKKWRTLVRTNPEEYGETFWEDIRRVFEGYERTYFTEPLKTLYIEKQGEVKMPNGIPLHYIVDKVGIDKDGRRWLIDRKSHKTIPEDRDRFSDIQLVLYYWAWNLEHPKEQVDGIIWDYIRTKPPTIPEVLKKGELTKRSNIDTDYYTYMQAIRQNQVNPAGYTDILAKLKIRGSSDFYRRISLPSPTKEVVLEVVADAAQTAAEILAVGKTDKVRNLSRDCSWCEYYQLCHAEMRGLDADFVRKTQYEIKDPEERYKKDQAE